MVRRRRRCPVPTEHAPTRTALRSRSEARTGGHSGGFDRGRGRRAGGMANAQMARARSTSHLALPSLGDGGRSVCLRGRQRAQIEALTASAAAGEDRFGKSILLDAEQTYRSIRLIRRFEEKCVELKAGGRIQGSMHLCCGQEAIPVGACRALEPRDSITVTYRGHGWAIARGLPLHQLFAELEGRDSSLCGGRGGSPYFSSPQHGLLGENSIVGAGLPIA